MTNRTFIKKIKKTVLGLAAALLLPVMLTACSKGPDKYELRDTAVELFNQGDYPGAISKLNEALDASDGEVSELQCDILKYRAECELRLGKYDDAKTTYSALLKVDEDEESLESYAGYLNELGALEEIKLAAEMIKRGEYQEAYDALSVYAYADGSLTGRTALYNKAVCAEYMGRFEEAYTLFSEYLSAYPDDAKAAKEAEFCRTRS